MAPTRRYAHAVITLHDPELSPSADYLPTAAIVDIGGTVQWRSETPDYPEFEIIFLGENPFNTSTTGWTGKGKLLTPVVAKVDNPKEGEFEYEIKHKKPGGTVHRKKHFITARICLVCR